MEQVKIDQDLIWEALWGYEKNLMKIYQLLHAEIEEVGTLLYHHESKDEVFKNQLSDTHKRYYDKFEELFRIIKSNASKLKTLQYNPF